MVIQQGNSHTMIQGLPELNYNLTSFVCYYILCTVTLKNRVHDGKQDPI